MIWLRLILFVVSLISSAGVLQQQSEYTAEREEYEDLMYEATMKGASTAGIEQPSAPPVTTMQWLTTGLLWAATVYTAVSKGEGTATVIGSILDGIGKGGASVPTVPVDVSVRPSDGMVDGLASLIKLANQWYGPLQTLTAAVTQRGVPDQVSVVLRYGNEALQINSSWVPVAVETPRPPVTPA